MEINNTNKIPDELSEFLNKIVEETTRRDFDMQKPDTHPIRYYEVIDQVFKNMNTMSLEQKVGAAKVLSPIADYFWHAHFDKQAVFNQKSLVKTLDEIRDNLNEEIHHESEALEAKADKNLTTTQEK